MTTGPAPSVDKYLMIAINKKNPSQTATTLIFEWHSLVNGCLLAISMQFTFSSSTDTLISVPRPLVAVKEFSIRVSLGQPPIVCVPRPPNLTFFISRYQEMSASFSTSHGNHKGIVNIMQLWEKQWGFPDLLCHFINIYICRINKKRPLVLFSPHFQGWLIFFSGFVLFKRIKNKEKKALWIHSLSISARPSTGLCREVGG